MKRHLPPARRGGSGRGVSPPSGRPTRPLSRQRCQSPASGHPGCRPGLQCYLAAGIGQSGIELILLLVGFGQIEQYLQRLAM
jgi:hypothetical protein